MAAGKTAISERFFDVGLGRRGHASPTVLYRYLVYIRIWSGRGWGSGGCGVMLRRRGGMSQSHPSFLQTSSFGHCFGRSFLTLREPVQRCMADTPYYTDGVYGASSRSQPRPHAAPRRPRRLPEEGGLCRSYALSTTVSSFVCGDRIVRTQTSLRLTRRARDVHDGGANGLGGGHQEAEHVRDPTIGVRTS